jgi:6,7-dimethyl-8-ribityllumazine synthase
VTAQHTPEPWLAPCNYGASRFEIQGGGRRVAVVDRIEDAVLISAAAEMLAVLKEVHATDVEAIVDLEALGIPVTEDGFALTQKVKAVIAKATTIPGEIA